MKVKRLTIKNVGILKDETIELNKPLICFYGDLMQGKTTILNSVKWLFGGSYPDDIIRHGENEASVTLEIENGSITREWYRQKPKNGGEAGPTTDRPIVFIKDGKQVKRPVEEIKKFLNPYLLDNEYLKKMGETERKQYFTQLFGVDTSEIDKEYSKTEEQARELRAKIKGYGEIDLTEITLIDVDTLRNQKASVLTDHTNYINSIDEQNEERRSHNRLLEKKAERKAGLDQDIPAISKQIRQLEIKLAELSKERDEIENYLGMTPPMELLVKPNAPDTAGIDNKIIAAVENNAKYEQYQKNLVRAKAKEMDESDLADLAATLRELKQKKAGKLAEISETCGIAGLVFDETGNFSYEGTSSAMLSTSQIMKLSNELSALYPSGFGIDLIDRAESLGKSVFLFVEKAQKEEKTILASIVGEKPAVVPENVGVFVVNDGEVTNVS
jgi:recombinational DNA repair ATPase RecF